MKENNRVLYFDVLNICACFCVICLHCNGVVHYLYNNIHVWYQALLVETLCYWAVPIFLMLTGATLLTYNEKYSTRVYFEKRFKRTVIPWLFWSIAIFVLKVFVGNIAQEEVTVTNFISLLLTSKIETVYWYFPVLFAIYMAIPVLAKLREVTEHKAVFWYMFWMAFFTYSVFPVICKSFQISWNSALQFPLTGSGYIIFVLLGYLLSTETVSKKHRHMIYVAAVASVLFRYGGTVLFSAQSGEVNKLVFGYTQFHSVILASAVFLLFKNTSWNTVISTKNAKILSRISSCSLGIYLIHKLVMTGLISCFSINVAMWQWRYLAPFFIYLVCLTVVTIMKRLPIIRKIVP